jgi:hypothetical protein
MDSTPKKRINHDNEPLELSAIVKGSPYYNQYNAAHDELDADIYADVYADAQNPREEEEAHTPASTPKRKKKKVLRTILIIVLSVSLLAGGGFVWYFRDVLFNKPQDSTLGEYYGLFAYAPVTDGDSLFIDYSAKFSEFEEEIAAGMAKDATAEQKALAAYIIYRIGCLSDATAPYKAKYGTGSGSAQGIVQWGDEEIVVSGGMNATMTSSEIRYPMDKPDSVAHSYSDDFGRYIAGEEYTQIPQGAVNSSNTTIAKPAELILRATLPFARRYLSTPEYKTVWDAKTGTCVISEERAVAEFVEKEKYITKRTHAELEAEALANGSARPYDESWGDIYGLTAKDMSLHVINPDTILGDTVKIAKVTGIGIDGEKIEYYSVEFELDTVSNKGTPQSATYYAEQFYKAQAPDAFMNYLQDYFLNYSYLKVRFGVFTNGYFRTWSTKETWSMGGKIANAATAEIISDNDSMEAFCYDYDTVMQGFVNRYYGDLPIANMPMSSLPFYSLLQSYTPQEYGSYR